MTVVTRSANRLRYRLVAPLALAALASAAACQQATQQGTHGPSNGGSSTRASGGSGGPAGGGHGGSSASRRTGTTAASGKPAKPTTASSSKPGRAAVTLPNNCYDVLSDQQAMTSAGKLLRGRTIYVKGVPIKQIGRTSRVTCSYGVTQAASAANPPLQVSLSAYSSARNATRRVVTTIVGERAGHAAASDTSVGGHDATLLAGKDGDLLVFADGKLTVAVSVSARAKLPDPAESVGTAATQVLRNLGRS